MYQNGDIKEHFVKEKPFRAKKAWQDCWLVWQ